MSQFPISYVVSETGVNPITLRAWETRYNLINPTRTPSGHRLYTQEDISKIKEIIFLKSKGYRVSQISEMLDDLLSENDCLTRKIVDAVIESVSTFNASQTINHLQQLIQLAPIEVFADSVYPLLLQELKKALWSNSIYFTQERAFFFDQLRFTLHQLYHQYCQTFDGYQIKILGYNAPFMITEYYVNNLFLAIQLSQYKLTNCLINHIDSFEEIVDEAKNNPNLLVICNLGCDNYQFQQCARIASSRGYVNLLFHHPTITLDTLSSTESKLVLPCTFQNKISMVRHQLSIIV